MSHPRLTFINLRFSAVLLVFSMIFSVGALAQPTTAFMLQFGSFESTKEANARIDALKAKHGGLIGALPSRVVEVALPDNLTVYRTQSGPVPSRADAQSICAQLASNGDECYVVETAMVQPSTTIASSIDAVADNVEQAKNSLTSVVSVPSNVVADRVTEAVKTTKNAVSQTAAKATSATLSALPGSNVLVPSASLNLVAPAITNAAVTNVANNAVNNIASGPTKTGVASSSKALSDTMPAVKALSSAPRLSNISSASEKLDETAAIDKKLAEIKTPDASAVKVVENTATNSPAPKSFWSSINPFSSNSETVSKPKAITSNATTKAAIEATNKAMAKDADDTAHDAVVQGDEVVNKATTIPANTAQKNAPLIAAPASTNASANANADAAAPNLQAGKSDAINTNVSRDVLHLPPPTPAHTKLPVIETVAESANISPQSANLTRATSQSTLANNNKVIALPSVPQTLRNASSIDTASDTASLRLPPPPPLTEASKPIFDRNNKELPISTGAAISSNLQNPSSVAVSTPNAKAPFGDASNETLARLGKAPRAGDGNVKVEEAQRVPLTQTNNAPFVKDSGSSVAPPDASIPLSEHSLPKVPDNLASPAVAVAPSADIGKNVWAELGRFSDASKALAFWDQFRNKHQDFPVVRVRITQTYAQKSRGESAVNLRVGPFSKEASIAYLCHNIEAQDIYCRSIIDSGASSASSDNRIRQAQGEATLANSNAAHATQTGVYWVQLGSYPSLAQAQNTWADLKTRYEGALAGVQPNISVPVLASSARPQYRLRSGPFATNIAATQACLRLKAAGGNCLVSTQ